MHLSQERIKVLVLKLSESYCKRAIMYIWAAVMLRMVWKL